MKIRKDGKLDNRCRFARLEKYLNKYIEMGIGLSEYNK